MSDAALRPGARSSGLRIARAASSSRAQRSTDGACGSRSSAPLQRGDHHAAARRARSTPSPTAGVDRADITVAWVPGAFELPLVARASPAGRRRRGGQPRRGHPRRHRPLRLRGGRVRAGRPAGRSSTPACPVIFGVLTTDTLDQALERARPDETNKGREAALAAVEMATMLARRARPPSGRPASAPPTGSADAAPGPAQGLARAGHPRAVRRRRPGRAPVLGRRLPGHHRRPPGRRGADPAAPGDPGLRGRGPVRPRHHRARLGRGAGRRGRHPRRAALLQGHRQPDPGRPRGGRRLAGQVAGRPDRPGPAAAGLDRVPRAHPAVPRRGAACEAEISPLLRGHRGQGARHRRLRGRDHRDRPGAAGGRAADHRHPARRPTPS